MPLITCLNGHEIELLPEQFGQRIACPMCQLMIVVSPPRPGEPLLPKYEVLCENKHVLRVKSKYLGTQIRCPQCQGLAWVTTDRLQRNIPVVEEPFIPVAIAETVPPRKPAPVPPRSVIQAELPIAVPLDDIPIAEVDEAPKVARKPLSKRLKTDDDNEEPGDAELTKAERRNLKLVDQGLGFLTGSMVGYLSIQMVAMILGFLLLLISRAISSLDGMRSFGTFADVIGWIILIALVLNTLLYLGGAILTFFTPFITGATIWFILSFMTTVAFLSWRVFQLIDTRNWKSVLTESIFSGSLLTSKLKYFVSEGLFIVMWLLLMLGLWQLGKFVRKPMLRQRIILLMLAGTGCWAVIAFYPYLGELIQPTSEAAIWVLVIIRVLLTLAAGIFLILQLLKIMSEVRTVMLRRK